MTFLKPIIPKIAKNAEKFLNISLSWNNIKSPLLNHKINNFFSLYRRIQKLDLVNFLKTIS
nr:hypothetical protein [Buchnera aphidicola]